MNKKFRVLYFGSYDPNYSRNRTLINGLRQNEVEVLECQDNSPGLGKFINLFKKHKKFKGQYDVMVVGFLGQQIVPFARLITRKPIIFDAFLSLYDSNVFDRKTTKIGSLKARYYWILDWLSMKMADIVLFDTQEHIKYVVNEFGIKGGGLRRIFVGTDESVFFPVNNLENSTFTVHFHGSFIPLQGVDCILKAAKILEDKGVEFNILGDGQTYSAMRKLGSELNLKNTNFIKRVEYAKLPEYINKGDICLGIFGKTPKAGRVIPNKVYEYVAMKKPVITADTLAIRELFEEDDMLLIKPEPDNLAEAILRLKNDPDLRHKISENAFNKFSNLATVKILGNQLEDIAKQLI